MKRIDLAGLRGLALASIVACNSASRDAGAFTSAGVTHLEQGEYDRAIRDFDRALALQPGFVVAWKNRALAFKGVTRRGMPRLFERLGLVEIALREWQPGHYELVTARKP